MSTGVSGMAAAMVSKWRYSSASLGLRNMGWSTDTAAAPLAAAILASRTHFLVLMAPTPK